jgi:hypothetical protein
MSCTGWCARVLIVSKHESDAILIGGSGQKQVGQV